MTMFFGSINHLNYRLLEARLLPVNCVLDRGFEPSCLLLLLLLLLLLFEARSMLGRQRFSSFSEQL